MHYDGQQVSFGFYMVVYKKSYCGNVLYGQNKYDYDNGTLLFFAPNQSMRVQGLTANLAEGWMLMFYPELCRGTSLDGIMQKYSFFGYSMNEALHISEREENLF